MFGLLKKDSTKKEKKRSEAKTKEENLVKNLNDGIVPNFDVDITLLDLSKSILNEKAISIICTLVAIHPNLQFIDLSNTQLPSISFKTLIQTICANQFKTKLKLDGFILDDLELDLPQINLLRDIVSKIISGENTTINPIYMKLLDTILEKRSFIDFTGCSVTEDKKDEIYTLIKEVIYKYKIQTIEAMKKPKDGGMPIKVTRLVDVDILREMKNCENDSKTKSLKASSTTKARPVSSYGGYDRTKFFGDDPAPGSKKDDRISFDLNHWPILQNNT